MIEVLRYIQPNHVIPVEDRILRINPITIEARVKSIRHLWLMKVSIELVRRYHSKLRGLGMVSHVTVIDD